MKNRFLSSMICFAVLAVGAVSLPTTASAAEPPPPPTQAEIVKVLEQSAQLVPTTDLGNGPTIVIRDESGKTIKNIESPDFSAGLGWNIYLYFTRGEWSWLQGLSYAALSAAVCAWVAATIAGAIACGVVAYIIYSIVDDYGVPPTGYCKEVKISYGGSFKGAKNVKRSC